MTLVGSGNFSGLHYSKKTCQEIIEKFLEENNYRILKYDLDFKTAREMASSIMMGKRIVAQGELGIQNISISAGEDILNNQLSKATKLLRVEPIFDSEAK